jgi:hypothetical protein
MRFRPGSKLYQVVTRIGMAPKTARKEMKREEMKRKGAKTQGCKGKKKKKKRGEEWSAGAGAGEDREGEIGPSYLTHPPYP